MVYERLPWRDRFNEPTPRDLRKGLSKDATLLFDRARRHLLDLEGVHERIAWYGHCWCWAVEFKTERAHDPLAVLIPSPEDLQLAMPLDQGFITSLPVKRLKRAVRDGLDLASDPFDTNWGVWSLQPTNVLDELEDLAERRLRHLRDDG